VVAKPSSAVTDGASVEVAAPPRFVSRGGDKLDNGIEDLADEIRARELTVTGARALDIGASTGGFTDCLLQRGAIGVVAVDVGYGQLHQRLRDDRRVTVMERTNARHLDRPRLPWTPDLLVCDASFIPLATVLPAPVACMAPGFWGLILCKPQFEAGRERLNRAGSKGVLRDAAVRDEVLAEAMADLRALGMSTDAVVEARPRGPKGNVEYVVLVRDARPPAGRM
jgi:23S rRNA (cytidine1920-2'-O)/16S rRNA (cytidine1409-2'-O)-methyltransferase